MHENWDEPMWSYRRLFDAFCVWLFFLIEHKNTQTLLHKLKYFRRDYAEEHEQKGD